MGSGLCLSCGERPEYRAHVCGGCWRRLPRQTRERLCASAAPSLARDRLFQLLSAIRRGVRLGEIRVSA